MDDALVNDAGEGYLGTSEIRLPRAVMYELHHDLSLADADRDYGWPTGTAAALKHRYPERWRKERNRCIDWGVSQFQSARLNVMEQLTAGCENALTILKAAMSGNSIAVVLADGSTELRPVTKDMQIAAREWIRAHRDMGRDLGDVTPADTDAAMIDEESEVMEAHAERLGVLTEVESN